MKVRIPHSIGEKFFLEFAELSGELLSGHFSEF